MRISKSASQYSANREILILKEAVKIINSQFRGRKASLFF